MYPSRKAFRCSHTFSNNKFDTIADLSVLVKHLITQMCPIGPSIQVCVADSILKSLPPSHLCHSFPNFKSYINVLKFESKAPQEICKMDKLYRCTRALVMD